MYVCMYTYIYNIIYICICKCFNKDIMTPADLAISDFPRIRLGKTSTGSPENGGPGFSEHHISGYPNVGTFLCIHVRR